jgi:hypothetical protein
VILMLENIQSTGITALVLGDNVDFVALSELF